MNHSSVAKKDLTSALIAGFALFASFFGAGNLIFPPLLGNDGGKLWWLAFLVFLMADAGLAVVAVLSVLKTDGTMESLTSPLGRITSLLICSVLMLVVGPFVVAPRTCATSYELSVKPLLPGLSPLLFSLIFFAIVALLTIRPSKVVDIVGKFLTPILLLTLLVLCIKGILTPLGPVAEPNPYVSLVRLSLISGYQTMDALMSLPLSIIIIKSITQRGYTEKKEQGRILIMSCFVAFMGLFMVYAGLCYLGATTSSLPDAATMAQTELLVFITNGLLAKGGVALLALIVFLACLTTAIGMTSAMADFTARLTKGKLSYAHAVLLSCAIGVVLSNLGTRSILEIAEPLLTLLYPIFLIMVFLVYFSGKLKNPWIARGAVIAASLFTLLQLGDQYQLFSIPFLYSVPFATMGLGWILPAIAGGLLGGLIRKK